MCKVLATLLLIVTVLQGCNIALPNRPTPRDRLDAIWEKRMLEGHGVRMWLDEAWQPIKVEEGGSLTVHGTFSEQKNPLSYLYAFDDPYGITVLRNIEGYWHNGGWTLTGGPLARASDGKSTFELYGKTIIRTLVHIPAGIFHRDPPSETGYEFFLIQRSEGTAAAAIVRRWVFQPDDVVLDPYGYTRVEGVLDYEPSTRTAKVSIKGLKRSIEERVLIVTPEQPLR